MRRELGPPFVLSNALTIAMFALGGLLAPQLFWSTLGVVGQNPLLTRVMAWYLLVFALAALATWRHPERHPWVVIALGLEKIGPAIAFPWLVIAGDARLPLLFVGVADAILSVMLLVYGRALWARSEARYARS